MGNNDGGDIYGDGERHDNYTKSNSDGNTDDDSNDNDIDMDFDSDINMNSDGGDDDLEGDGNMEHDGVEGTNADKGCESIKIIKKIYLQECLNITLESVRLSIRHSLIRSLKVSRLVLINFYLKYAAICGFDIRLGSQIRASDDTVVCKYVYCNREGEKNVSGDETSGSRRRILDNMLHV
ncbi:hypothetical protein CASFOL_012198 [Castilleja foliolosa]|uniref:Transposase n=1 Tax=Castilleja foliolosa TaxID=1961234 RepID=A0ABD3DRB7_9LAMI